MSPGGSRFRSPLYRLGRAPVLRVFVPSPEGDWLSDASIVECEDELRRSGVLKLLRVGDIVWDVAVGDEGNLGRLIWDGSYLVVCFSSDSCCKAASDIRLLQDLDYRYSRMGELSPYFHSLAFAPSYFHRVIRIGSSATHNPHCNPLVYVDVSPWGREIATNLQLLQDRARTETYVLSNSLGDHAHSLPQPARRSARRRPLGAPFYVYYPPTSTTLPRTVSVPSADCSRSHTQRRGILHRFRLVRQGGPRVRRDERGSCGSSGALRTGRVPAQSGEFCHQDSERKRKGQQASVANLARKEVRVALDVCDAGLTKD